MLSPRLAVESVLVSKLGQFARDYPEIVLDVTTDDSRMDIVAGGFDAGIHLGEYIKDMIAVREGGSSAGDCRLTCLFESHQKPKSPVTSSNINASTLNMDRRACIDGSFKKERSLYPSLFTGHLSLMT
ncbi:MAG: hypothetical protein WKF37_12415 [Bryobacteraceae bacterium]